MIFIGPPASGKTTALRQSGLEFPFDLTDDLQGVGGTRNCDWFFTEDAVLIDTAGRYVQQESQPDVDAAEWLGFLDLLKKHRGRRALNGVIVAIPVDVLAEGDAQSAPTAAIRKRLTELYTRLEIRLPVYLLVTKADLVKGFEPSFEGLSTADREQVWGASFAPGERPTTAPSAASSRPWSSASKAGSAPAWRPSPSSPPAPRSSAFPPRSPASKRRSSSSSTPSSARAATRRAPGSAASTSRRPPRKARRSTVWSARSPRRSACRPRRSTPRRGSRGGASSCRRLLTDVIFGEAGLATLDPKAEHRRLWLWRGGAVAAAAILVLGALAFTVSYLSNRGAVAAQADEFERLRATLAPAAARQAPLEPSDLNLALEAVGEVEGARAPLPGLVPRLVGPSAAPQIEAAQEAAYTGALRNLLAPRMVALLEATMWRQVRDPEFMLGALKTYRMLTGLSQLDPDFAKEWWATRLPAAAETPPFPTDTALAQQMDAIDRMVYDTSFVPPDDALVAAALDTVCSIPLAQRAYQTLLSDPAATALPEWVPANFAGPNGAKVFVRRSEKTLRVGIPGIFTYAGFHEVVQPRLEDVAAEAALDRSVFAGGCPESADVSVSALADDMLKLYYEDFVAQWDGFLRDVTLAPLTDLPTATANLKDLASADSALKRLLVAVVFEVDLARPAEAAAEGDGGAPKGASKILGKLGKLGKLAKKGAKYLPTGGATAELDTSGQEVSDHFKPLRGAVAEVDGVPPALDAAVASLTALSSVLQTVTASPDAEQAIKDQGGLAELTGAVANQAAVLPPPLDEWLSGIAGDTTSITEQAVVSKLNAIWKADVLPFCKAALSGRYPFDAGSGIDVNTSDFARVFSPGGLIDGFTNDHLLPYVDTAQRPWRWRADLGLDDGALAALERARGIRDALFPGGAGPIMAFTLEPKDSRPTPTA